MRELTTSHSGKDSKQGLDNEQELQKARIKRREAHCPDLRKPRRKVRSAFGELKKHGENISGSVTRRVLRAEVEYIPYCVASSRPRQGS